MKTDEPAVMTTAAELAAEMREALFLLFKHSFTCPMSATAFAEYSAFVRAHPEVRTAWLDVRASRDLAQQVARDSGVRHESPQALLFAHGKVRWHASHHAITRQCLEAAVRDQSR